MELFNCPTCQGDFPTTLRNGSQCNNCVAQAADLRTLAAETGANLIEPEPLSKKDVVLRELADRELCRRNLLPLVERFAPDYEAGWVHKDICARLEAFSLAVERKESPRLMIFLPPRSGKSEIASRNFPAWHLGRNPTHEIIEVSYSASLALDFSRDVRARLRDPLYKEIFEDCALDPDTQALEHWMTTAGGGYVAAGVSGPLTGRGMHIGIIDDPVKNSEEAESQKVREAQKDWYASTFYTRLAPGGGVLLIMTRWHHDDLAGWLLREQKTGGDKYDVVLYPAIAEQDEVFRKKGDVLHPERFDLKMMNRIKGTVGPRVWQSLYQQQPTSDDGDYFRRDYFKEYSDSDLPDRSEMSCYTAWDLAIAKNEDNDYTVGITVGVDNRDRVWVLALERGKWDGLDVCDKILDVHERWRSEFVGLEHGQISLSIGPLLNRRVQERDLWDFPFDYERDGLKTGRRDKVARARPIQGRMRQGMVLFPRDAEWFPALRNEMLAFPAGVHDDQVDAIAWVGQLIAKFSAPVQNRVKGPSWRDKILNGSSSHIAPSDFLGA